MRASTFAVLCTLAFSTSSASIAEEFQVEEALANGTDVPAVVAADIEKGLADGDRACLADSKTTVRNALEGTNIDLGGSGRALLLKPKLPSESKAAWGCFCGAYSCSMWIYSIEAGAAHRLWSSGGASQEIIERKDKGKKRMLLSSGSAGHQSATLYAWNGEKYAVLREKTVLLGQGDEMDEKVDKEIAAFRTDATR